MYKIPFIIGNLVSYFVPTKRLRERVRGKINLIFFRFHIARFIRKTYGEKLHSLKLVRQRTLKRVIFVANDKYYIKVFRSVSCERLKNFLELMELVRKVIPVEIPDIALDSTIPMYVCPRNTGIDIHTFDKKYIIKNQNKIKKSVHEIIDALQSIKVTDIPNFERFMRDMQGRSKFKASRNKSRLVLAHFDMNPSNFLFDVKLNVTALIDWDAITITNTSDADWKIFKNNWDKFTGK